MLFAFIYYFFAIKTFSFYNSSRVSGYLYFYMNIVKLGVAAPDVTNAWRNDVTSLNWCLKVFTRWDVN